MPIYQEKLKEYVDNGEKEKDFEQLKPRVVIDKNTGIPTSYQSFEYEMDAFLKDFKSKKRKQEYFPLDASSIILIGIPLLLVEAYFIIRQKKMKKQKFTTV